MGATVTLLLSPAFAHLAFLSCIVAVAMVNCCLLFVVVDASIHVKAACWYLWHASRVIMEKNQPGHGSGQSSIHSQ